MSYDPSKGLMLAAEIKDFRELPEGDYLVSKKLDGIRAYVALDAEGVPQVYSKSGKLIPNKEIQKLYAHKGAVGIEGELWAEGLTFNQLQSMVMSAGTPLASNLTLVLFPWSGYLPSDWFLCVCSRLLEIKVSNREMQHFNLTYRIKSQEGWMLRKVGVEPKAGRSTVKSGHLIKYKFKKSSEYMVIGKEEAIDKHGKPKGELGALVCTHLGSPGDSEFRVGTGFTSAQRKAFWTEDCIGNIVEVEYLNLHESGIPRHPVFKGFRDE